MSYHDSRVVAETLQWVERFVIGLDVCPFARSVVEQQCLRVVSASSRDVNKLFQAALEEIDRLQRSEPAQIATTLLVFSHGLQDFDHYLDFVDSLNDALVSAGLEGILQIASFHPHYCFADADVDDVANFTNRSPYPMVHFIREAELARALRAYPNPQLIPQRNIQRLRGMGTTAVKDLIEGSKHD